MDKSKLSVGLKVIVDRLGYEFVGVERLKEAGVTTLRLYVDKQGGILVDDCEAVSREVDAYLDQESESFEDNYLLEVSSPGIERPLFNFEDYSKFAGKTVSVKLMEMHDGRRRFSGVIDGVKDDMVLFDVDGEPFDLPFEKIASAHLVYVENKGQKKTFKKKGGKA